MSGVRVVKGFGAEQVQADKLRAKADDIRRVSLRAAKIRALSCRRSTCCPTSASSRCSASAVTV